MQAVPLDVLGVAFGFIPEYGFVTALVCRRWCFARGGAFGAAEMMAERNHVDLARWVCSTFSVPEMFVARLLMAAARLDRVEMLETCATAEGTVDALGRNELIAGLVAFAAPPRDGAEGWFASPDDDGPAAKWCRAKFEKSALTCLGSNSDPVLGLVYLADREGSKKVARFLIDTYGPGRDLIGGMAWAAWEVPIFLPICAGRREWWYTDDSWEASDTTRAYYLDGAGGWW